MFTFNCHMPRSRSHRERFLLIFLVFAGFCAGAAPLDAPPPEALTEARRIVQEMTDSQRGPYSRIRWYCNDGTIQPPVAYACSEHGGGQQHAEYSPQRERLAELGWSVGTIFAALSYDELFDATHRQQRLREIPLERYLTDIDDGWVLRRARNYRGRVQEEDEKAAGRELLLQLMSDVNWARENFLLIREAARTIPHGDDTDLARTVRRKAIQLAEIEPSAERWRAEIHSDPNMRTASRLRNWAVTQSGETRALAIELANDLDELYGAAGRQGRIAAALNNIGGSSPGDRFRESINTALGDSSLSRVSTICSAMSSARSHDFAELSVGQRLALVDALGELDSEVQLAFQEISSGDVLSRADTLNLSFSLLHCAFASGLLSDTELESSTGTIALNDEQGVSLDVYRAVVARLKRAPGWAMGTIRHTFAEPLIRYSSLDSRAARFSDDLLRGSPMWMLGDTLKTLSKDVDYLSGSLVEIAGKPVGAAVALNNGVARGTLRIFDTIEALEGAILQRTDIAVIPETIAELSPVAGILTLGEGNALSHVQLLARNFGIPNVAIDYDTLALLRPLEGRRVLMIVTSGGDVLLEADDTHSDVAVSASAGNIVVPLPDLERRELLILDEVGRGMSGKIVGPKAANLGELNRLFPGRVAPAIAIPFGIYAAHLDSSGLSERIGDAFAGVRNGTMDEASFNAELANVRREIAALRLSPEVKADLVVKMREQFGEPGTYGVFVRSDTNVEDLPQFTGAGLNETLPNIVQFDAQLEAVPRVWSSVLSPRALAWRSTVLANPDRIYASVLLMKSVPATKSGVLVTKNLFNPSVPGLTASTAWGVGGAVAGEAAETTSILAEHVEIISEAKSPYQRHIAPGGGVDMVPAPAGRVLEEAEIQQLRELATEVNDRYEPVIDDNGNQRPWDIEFGFIEGELTLFQIRPLVERGGSMADSMLRQLRPQATAVAPGNSMVRLDQLPGA
jgi:hypothetical protein